MNDLRDLYEELILDHNRNPRNYPKKPQPCNHTANGFNPLCGDEFQVHLNIDDQDVIQDIGFEGAGCAISTASASLMTEAVLGKDKAHAEALFRNVQQVLTEEEQGIGDPAELLGKLSVLIGVKDYPMRVKCATLAWHTLRAALEDSRETVCTE